MSPGLPSRGGTSSTCRRLFYAPCGTQRNRLLTSLGPENPEQSWSLAPATHNPGKAKPCGSARPPLWNGKGRQRLRKLRTSAQDTCPQTAAPGTGAGECRRGGGGEGPNDLAGAGSWLREGSCSQVCTQPQMEAPRTSANSWAQPGLQGRPWTCGSHRCRGSKADTGATRGRVGGLAGGRECHPGQRGGRCRRQGTRPS